MITCTRRLTFCAGHRVMGHENKCAHLHGHNYVVEIEAVGVTSPTDPIGRVIDFSVLKSRFGGWIERVWDHGFILHQEDVAAREAISAFNVARTMPLKDAPTEAFLSVLQRVHYLPYNPTAENLARYLLETVAPDVLADVPVRLTRVVVRETENCWASAEGEQDGRHTQPTERGNSGDDTGDVERTFDRYTAPDDAASG